MWIAITIIMLVMLYGAYRHISRVVCSRKEDTRPKRNDVFLSHSYMDVFYKRRLIQKYYRLKREHERRSKPD